MSSKTAGATSLGMQSENFGYSRVRLRRIKKLQFGVVNPNELVGTLCIRRLHRQCHHEDHEGHFLRST
jgi:hypothetical protein